MTLSVFSLVSHGSTDELEMISLEVVRPEETEKTSG
jgi:hypothetical protein